MNASMRLALVVVALPLVAHAQHSPTESTPAPTPPPEAAPATEDDPSANDLGAAADAVAAAARVTVEPASAATATSSASAEDDIDLAELGLADEASGYDNKLNIYGFADVQYLYLNFRKDLAFIPDQGGFQSGSLNVYLAKNLSEKLRFLAEVRYLHLPNGGQRNLTTIDTATGDPTNLGRPKVWGGISIERAYIEYDITPRLTIRAGRFLTPYGIWNIDHGSPTIVPTLRPYIIGEQYFPEYQTGLELHGMLPVGDTKFRYHVTVSNGRGPVEANIDPDRKPAFGGRLELETPLAGQLKVGVSGYAGRWTEAQPAEGLPPASYVERSYGADVQWTRGGTLVQGEVIGNDAHYRDNARARASVGFAADRRQWGAYALVGHRTGVWWNAMPFVVYEYNKPGDPFLYEKMHGASLGVNLRPTPAFVLKATYTCHRLFGDTRLLQGTITEIFMTQAAWVF